MTSDSALLCKQAAGTVDVTTRDGGRRRDGDEELEWETAASLAEMAMSDDQAAGQSRVLSEGDEKMMQYSQTQSQTGDPRCDIG